MSKFFELILEGMSIMEADKKPGFWKKAAGIGVGGAAGMYLGRRAGIAARAVGSVGKITGRGVRVARKTGNPNDITRFMSKGRNLTRKGLLKSLGQGDQAGKFIGTAAGGAAGYEFIKRKKLALKDRKYK